MDPPGMSRRTSVGSRQDDSDSDDDSPAQVASTSTGWAAQQDAGSKRKRERACDHCRSRKVRCNGFEKFDKVCDLCRRQGITCSYVTKSNKRKNRPKAPVAAETGKETPPKSDDPNPLPVKEEDDEVREMLTFQPSIHPLGEAIPASPDSVPSGPKPAQVFMGSSSTFALIGEAFRRDVKARPAGSTAAAVLGTDKPPAAAKFGWIPPWETEEYELSLGGRDFWPEPELAASLIDFYFQTCNLSFALFKEADFKKRFSRKDYLADRGFANVCLTLFAVSASHGFDDSRTWAPLTINTSGLTQTHGRHSAGWTYYYQSIRRQRRHTRYTEVSDLQISVLACIFLSHSSAPMGCWTVIGEGLSRAQEIGAHKTSSNQGEDPVEDDLRRRAFHCLLIFDAQFSGAVGRSPHIHQNVYDTPLPVQPPAPQDDLSSFYALTKIARLQRTTLFSLYALDSHTKTKSWVLQQMAALNSEVDNIQSSLPLSLRWDSAETDFGKLSKSAVVQLFLSHVIVLINRPSLPNWRNPRASPLSAASFDLLLSSALRSTYIFSELGLSGCKMPFSLISCQDAAAVLALALRRGQQAGVVLDDKALVRGLESCLRTMLSFREYWATTEPSSLWMLAILQMKNAVSPELKTLVEDWTHRYHPPPASISQTTPGGSVLPDMPPQAEPALAVPMYAYGQAPGSFAFDQPATAGLQPYYLPADPLMAFNDVSLEAFGFGMGGDTFNFDFEMDVGGGGGGGLNDVFQPHGFVG